MNSQGARGFDVSRAVWRKSTRSNGQGGECVEVAVLERAAWRTSTRSNANGGNCVEVAVTERAVGVRDSRDPSGPVLIFSPETWRAFLTGL